MSYLEKLVAGSQKEKTELCFNIIDYKRTGWFSQDDLADLISSIISTKRSSKQESVMMQRKVE